MGSSSSSWADFVSGDGPRDAIPVSPRFQAELPPYAPAGYAQDSGLDRFISKPVLADDVLADDGSAGKGRPNKACSCTTPGSMHCHKRHVAEKKTALKQALGPAYDTWEFDNIGNEVEEKWTKEEVAKLKSVIKVYPQDSRDKFLAAAVEAIPTKSRKEILDYYFTVHIARRMAYRSRRCGYDRMDTDDESGTRKRSRVSTYMRNTKSRRS